VTVSELKREYNVYLKKIKREIHDLLSGGAMSRKTLIDGIIARSPLSAEEKADFSAASVYSMYRSIIGTAIQKLQKYGDISVNEHNEITLVKTPSVIVKEIEVTRYIIDLLKDKTCTQKQIISGALTYFGADRTGSALDDEGIEATVRRLLPDLAHRKKIVCAYGKYSLCSDTIVIKKPRSLFEEFITLINSKGGEFFENYSAMLLDKYYQSIGMRVSYCNVIGGSDDGGIDVILSVSDQLGFSDKILVQCKQKNGSNVTLKELKEFIGAFYVEKGTRGIFMTNSRFHKEASLLFSDLNDIIPIDGPKLFDIAKSCECGIKLENGEYKIDSEFFAF
jgi:hypothetical protein